ncbi:hypothetical protein [Streptomyces sp. SAS_276]|uniref:hypothetical protein n=1 Tax=Streptomyces sp. SAS_276 TaxID=3412745 RepID=UPI00403C4056
MKAETGDLVPVGLMGRHGMPIDRFHGRPMNAVTWDDDSFVHTDPDCRAPAAAGPGETHRVRFGAFFAARMCGCCRVEPAAADADLADTAFDLVSLCEALEEEDEEAENREDPDYIPNYLRPNFNPDHWRYLQFHLSAASNSLRAHLWLLSWAQPTLSRIEACAERRTEEQRTLIDTAMVEKAAAALQQREQPASRLAQAWQRWRQREDWRVHTSPDYAHYDLNARQRPRTSGSAKPNATTIDISLRLPPKGTDEDGFAMVETLSLWEIAAIVAYKTTADWAGGVVALSAPPAVAQELLFPARGLDVTPLLYGTGRMPPSATPRGSRQN